MAGPVATAFARLHSSSHLPDRVPYADLPRAKVKLSNCQKPHGYLAPMYPFNDADEWF
jgi:hypothetical protein